MGTTENKSVHYDAFISYRHSELDMYVAKKVHKGLETFKVPKAVQQMTGKKSIARVFRDQEELPIGSDLDDNITTALKASEYLLVICSPRTPQSEWVIKEINTFIALHGRDKVLAILIEGEPNESFPQPLLVDENGNNVEPLAADVRGATKSEMDKKMKTELLRLCAPILGCRYDDLRQRHRERRMKAIMTAVSAAAAVIAILGISFGIYYAKTASIIKKSYELAEANRILAEENYNKAQENLNQAQINQSKYLADTSLGLSENGDRRAASLVALEALPGESSDRPFVTEAEYALSQSVKAYVNGGAYMADSKLFTDAELNFWNFNLDGTYAVAADTNQTIYVWTVADSKCVLTVTPDDLTEGNLCYIREANIVDQYLYIITIGGFYCFDLDKNLIWKERFSDSFYNSAINLQSKVIIVTYDQHADIYDLTKQNLLWSIEASANRTYGEIMVASADGTKLAFSMVPSEEDGSMGALLIADITTKETRVYHANGTLVHNAYFTQDNSLIVNSVNDDILNLSQSTYTRQIDCVNLETGEIMWNRTLEAPVVPPLGDRRIIKSRVYEDAEGTIHKEAMIIQEGTLYVWDLETGDELQRFNVSGIVVNFYLSASSGLGYLGSSNGDINVVNFSTGEYIMQVTVGFSNGINDFQIKGGVIGIGDVNSVTLFTTTDGPNMNILCEESDAIGGVLISPGDKYLMVNQSLLNKCVFYDLDTGMHISEYDYSKDNIIGGGFFDDTTYYLASYWGKVYLYNIADGEVQTILTDQITGVDETYYDQATGLLYLYDLDQIAIVDLKKRGLVKEIAFGDVIFSLKADSVNNKLYIFARGNGLTEIDLASGNVELVPGEDYYLDYNYGVQNLDVSPDGKYLAMCCSDNKIRVMELGSYSTYAEIDSAFHFNSFVQFSDDGQNLYFQGDDRYLSVFSLTQKQVVFVSGEQYLIEKLIEENPNNGTLGVYTSEGLYILDKASYGLKAYVMNGALIAKTKNLYICYKSESTSGTVCSFPIMSLEDLKAEQQKLFQGESLSQKERIMYHIGE